MNLSARLMVAAHKLLEAKGGALILCDQETYQQAKGAFVWHIPETIKVKGKAEPVSVYQPTARAPTAQVFMSGAVTMVGRDMERDQVFDMVHAMSDTGTGTDMHICAYTR